MTSDSQTEVGGVVSSTALLEYLEAELPKAEKRLEWNKYRGGRGYNRALEHRNQIKKDLAAERRKYSNNQAH